jgi:sucrose phosphorylase
MDVHQIRGTYYSMLDCNDTAYLAARAIQFFTPGIPQVYYVGLMAGKNDNEAVERTGEGREINRHNYTLAEISRETKKDVVKRLITLIRFRNAHPAFGGTFKVDACDDQSINLSWNDGDASTNLVVKLHPLSATILYNEPGNKEIRIYNL